MLIGIHPSSPPTVAVNLGKTKKDEVITLSLTQVLTHTSTPLPAEIGQTDPQYLLWKSNSTYVDSWYPTDVERVKIRYVELILDLVDIFLCLPLVSCSRSTKVRKNDV